MLRHIAALKNKLKLGEVAVMLKGYYIGLILVWAVIAVSVLSMSFLYPNGRMSSDSYSYLKLADNFLKGDGMYIKDAYEPTKVNYFAQWPPGYPMMIAVIAESTGAGVFWAAKIVNLIMLALIFVVLSLVYKDEALTMGLIFLLASPLNVMSMTWTEPAMILGLLLVSYFLYQLFITTKWQWVVALVAGYGWIFFMRYVGVFTLLVVGMVGVVAAWRKRYKLMWQSLIVAVVGLAISAAYLWHNVLETGYLLGRAASSNELGLAGILRLVDYSVLTELNLLFDLKLGFWATVIPILLLLLLALYIYGRNQRREIQTVSDHRGGIEVDKKRVAAVVGVGMSQALAATYLLVFPGTIDNRYLLPVLVLGLIGWTDYLRNRPMHLKSWRQFLIAVAILSWVINVPGKIIHTAVWDGEKTYPETVEETLSRYKDVPAGSLVAFGNKEIEYLRNDLYTAYLAAEVVRMDDREFNAQPNKMNLFLHKSCETGIKPFYIDRNEMDRGLSYWGQRDASVRDYLLEHGEDRLWLVNDCDEHLEPIK